MRINLILQGKILGLSPVQADQIPAVHHLRQSVESPSAHRRKAVSDSGQSICRQIPLRKTADVLLTPSVRPEYPDAKRCDPKDQKQNLNQQRKRFRWFRPRMPIRNKAPRCPYEKQGDHEKCPYRNALKALSPSAHHASVCPPLHEISHTVSDTLMALLRFPSRKHA